MCGSCPGFEVLTITMENMSLLERIRTPRDLRALSKRELERLAEEIRAFLVKKVSRTGGHLGPNLGVVELTLGLHRVFNSPNDPIIFDTGHQSYVHKMVTGRLDGFDELRQQGGLSGYPDRGESEHDWVENSHASTALSWAHGMAKGFKLRGENRTVVAVVGDGSLTGGMAWEALNNIATEPGLPLIIVVNDNGRSYTPTVGGLAVHLSGLRTDHRYEKTLSFIKRRVTQMPLVGRPFYDLLHGFKTGVKDVLVPQGMFSDLGIKYTGPIDGHDIGAVISTLEQARQFGSPVIVHFITRKGKGFRAAEENEEDRFHAVGKINEFTGEPLSATVQATWTDAFAESMVQLGEKHPNLVAMTAAMLHPVGLGRFAAVYPERTIDVGIAEQHAVTAAAGLAASGMHPVVAVYSTFLNRAFDQAVMDVGLHKAGVTFALDRAGVTGTDGPSHNGMWDVAIMGLVPNVEIAAPRDQTRLHDALERAVTVDDRLTVVRYSKERLPDEMPAVTTLGQGRDAVDILHRSDHPTCLVVGYGQFAGLGLSVAERLEAEGVATTVADPTWVIPVSPELVKLAAHHDFVVTIEDNLVESGLGHRLRDILLDEGITNRALCFGIPQRYLPHGSRDELLEELGLTPKAISRRVLEAISGSELFGQQGREEVDLPGAQPRLP